MSGDPVNREVSFRFALDLSAPQQRLAWQLAGTRRFVFNELLEAVHERMDARAVEAELGRKPLTTMGWGKLDLIRQVKMLRDTHSWLAAQPWDVAECAAVDLASALKNYSESRRGVRKGKRVGFPKRKSRKTARQSFRLRHPDQQSLGESQARVEGSPQISRKAPPDPQQDMESPPGSPPPDQYLAGRPPHHCGG